MTCKSEIEPEDKAANVARAAPGSRLTALQFALTDVALLVMTLIWGLNFIIVKTTLAEISPFTFAALRFVLAATVLIAIVHFRQGGFHIPRAAWGRVAVVGFIGTTLYQPMFINGLALTKASNSALILASTPIFIVLFNRVLGRERFTRRGWFGIGLSLIGIVLVVLSGGEFALDPKSIVGDGLILGATFCWALYSVLSAPLLQRYSPLSVTGLSTLFGAVPLLLMGIPAIVTQDWGKVSLGGWSGLVYSALFAIVIAYIIWNVGVKRIGGARTAIYNNLTPVIATLAAAFFLNEPLTLAKLIGAAVIFVGLYLARTSNLVLEPEA